MLHYCNALLGAAYSFVSLGSIVADKVILVKNPNSANANISLSCSYSDA